MRKGMREKGDVNNRQNMRELEGKRERDRQNGRERTRR